jgi:protein-tyrosine phosphatase
MVCSGNICRSPLAAAALAAQESPGVVSVASAGIGALIGAEAHPEAIRVARLHGLDLGTHRARQFDHVLAQAHDLILVMELFQRQWIEQSFPFVRGRVHLLGKWREVEVADPFRKSPLAFDVAMEEILRAVADWRVRLG